MPGMARAKNVLPDPGLPTINILWTKNRRISGGFGDVRAEEMNPKLKGSSCREIYVNGQNKVSEGYLWHDNQNI